MPFRPVQNAGAPDPRLAQLLFNARRQRMQDERQAQVDRQNMLIAQQEAARKQQLHDDTRAASAQERFKKQLEIDALVGERKRTAESAIEGVIGSEVKSGQAALRAESDELLGMGGRPAGSPSLEQIVNSLQSRESIVPEARRDAISDRFLGPVNRDIENLAGFHRNIDPSSPAANPEFRNQSIDLQSATDARVRGRDFAIDQNTKESDAKRADKFAIRRESRQEARDALVREMAAKDTLAALERGDWTGEEISSWRRARETETKDVDDLNKDWRFVERFNPNDSVDSTELIQKWVRRADPGATVREGDVALMREMGVSTMEGLIAAFGALADADKKLPAEFGRKLMRSYKAMLIDSDARANEVFLGMEEFADDQNWTDGQRRKAMPRRRAIRMIRERINNNANAVAVVENSGPASRDVYNQAIAILSERTGRSEEDISVDEVQSLVRSLEALGSRPLPGGGQ